jgi:hypothetical protein
MNVLHVSSISLKIQPQNERNTKFRKGLQLLVEAETSVEFVWVC